MAKAATQQAKRPTRSTRSGEYLGRTKEGLRILRPNFRPESFTLRELDRAIRAAKRRQAEALPG